MSIIQLPSGRWRLQIRRRTLKVDEVFATEREARKAEKAYRGRGTRAHEPPAGGGLTIERAWDRYHTSLVFRSKKPTTQRSEETHVKAALRRFSGAAVGSITPEDVEGLVLAGLDEGRAPDTIRNEVAALSSLLGFCLERRVIARNPCIGVARPSVVRKVRRMAPGDEGSLMALLNHPKLRFRAVARLCLLVRETGARPGEWVTVRWSDLDLNANKVTFANTKYKGMPRTIPLTTAAIGLLSAQLEDIAIRHLDLFGDTQWVFPTVGRNGEIVPLRYSGTVRDLKDEKLLPSHFRTHSGRHEYISKLVEDSDLDDARIMSLVGHHSPTSMQIYAHARNVRFRGQLEALEPKRRDERARSFSKAAGVPTQLVTAYLEHRRKRNSDENLADPGDELLFDSDAVGELKAVARKLGDNESERMATLLEIRESVVRKEQAARIRAPREASGSTRSARRRATRNK